MLNLFKCNFCIQNQVELADSIAYCHYLVCAVRSYGLVCAVLYLVGM